MSSLSMSTVPVREHARYIEKINLINLKACPFSLPASSWCSDPTQWPEVSLPASNFYIIQPPAKQITGEIFYFSAFSVGSMLVNSSTVL